MDGAAIVQPSFLCAREKYSRREVFFRDEWRLFMRRVVCRFKESTTKSPR
jgi:hypothetical protein